MLDTLKELFPIKVMVTKEMINEADKSNPYKCIGAKALRSVMPKQFAGNITWSNITGTIYGGLDSLLIGTEEKLPMMCITKPMEVTFTVIDVY